MAHTKRLIWATLLLAACGGPASLTVEAEHDEFSPGWATDPTLPERAARAARIAAEVWGGDPALLEGWTLHFTARLIHDCGDNETAIGCTSRETGLLRVAEWSGRTCVEQSALAHEVGHIVLPGGHEDPRWTDDAFWERMKAALYASVPPEDSDCADTLRMPWGLTR